MQFIDPTYVNMTGDMYIIHVANKKSDHPSIVYPSAVVAPQVRNSIR